MFYTGKKIPRDVLHWKKYEKLCILIKWLYTRNAGIFNIRQYINAIHHNNRPKEKICTIFSIDAEKASGDISFDFMCICMY